MNVVCIRHTDLPGSTSLFGDLVYRFDRVSQFYAYPPRLDEAANAAASIEYPAERRAALVAALAAQNAGAGAAADEHLELLKSPETVVVATGQQVGLFGGPIFSIYKALTAAKYAAELRGRGQPAVAVFWLATEDHDLEEIDHAWVFNGRLEAHRVAAIAESQAGRPVGEVAMSDDPAASLADLLVGLPESQAVAEKVRRFYRSGARFGQAFRDFIRDLLAPYGLITLDPMDPAIRRLAAPFLAKAVEAGPELIDSLLERGENWKAPDITSKSRSTARRLCCFASRTVAACRSSAKERASAAQARPGPRTSSPAGSSNVPKNSRPTRCCVP